MAKAATATKETAPDPNAAPIEGAKAPSGFRSRDGDLVGYWESAAEESRTSEAKVGSLPVLFTPLHRTLSDSKIDKTKHSTLIHCRLEEACKLRSAEKGEGYKSFPKGSLFGIWAKPGMKALATLANTVVWMGNNGFKPVGKQSNMALYSIESSQTGDRLRVNEDRRDQSLPTELRAKRDAAPAAPDDDGGDIPF